MFLFNKRKRYVKAMLRAINLSAQPLLIGGYEPSKTDGLRVIRRFERVNGIKFDPFDPVHVDMVSMNGNHEAFFRSVRWKLNKLRGVA